ncbi:MAG: AraC family transcriptional regulator [Candidatus Binatia bacterium]
MPAGYFDFVLRLLCTTPQVAAALLDGTGVSPARLSEPDAEISLGQQMRQLRNANRLFPPGWGLVVGRAFQPSTHGAVGIAVISAPTLGAAFQVIERFCHLRNPSCRVRLRQHGAELRLELNECLVLPDAERVPLLETFLLSFQGFVEAVLGRPLQEGRFDIAAPAPPYVKRYADYFHAPVRFEAKTNAIAVPSAWRQLRCPFADRGMYAAAVNSLEVLARRADSEHYTAARVEYLMTANGDSGLHQAAAARLLGLSQRTLVRRLSLAGTNYKDLRDAQRRQRAAALLREGTLTAAEVACRLGYQDAANFSRACRRWFGVSPGALRAGVAATGTRRAAGGSGDAGGAPRVRPTTRPRTRPAKRSADRR